MVRIVLSLKASVFDSVDRHEIGAAMVEYALLLVGIALFVGIAVAALGVRLGAFFDLVVF